MRLPVRARRFCLITFVFAVGLTLGPSAWASTDMSGTWMGVPLVVWAWANMVVFWGFLWKFAGPGLREFLQKRKRDISEGLDRAQNQVVEAQEMRSKLSAQLDEFREQLAEQTERVRVEAERERERILQQAEADRVKLLEQTEREIDNQAAKARDELQQVAANLAASLASEKLAARLDGDGRDRLFDQDLDRLREVTS